MKKHSMRFTVGAVALALLMTGCSGAPPADPKGARLRADPVRSSLSASPAFHRSSSKPWRTSQKTRATSRTSAST